VKAGAWLFLVTLQLSKCQNWKQLCVIEITEKIVVITFLASDYLFGLFGQGRAALS
jgi:hypothetical protein